MEEEMDEQDKRVVAIVGLGEEGFPRDVDSKTARKYAEHLQRALKLPCLVTGTEHFPWEERFIFGYGSEKEHDKLRKTRPSHKDTFDLLAIEIFEEDSETILGAVERKSDGMEFSIGLDWLEAVDSKSENSQLLDDYSYWCVNCR